MAAEKDRRLYARFDIGFDEHDKIFPLSDAAFRALVEATLYSRRQLTDGFLAERLAVKRWGVDVLDELSLNDPEKPSLVRVEGGWQIHDFAEHQTTNADIEAKRAAGRKGAASRWQGKGMAPAMAPAMGDPMRNDATTLTKSESETETDNYSPISVSQVSNAREKLTDEDQEAVEAVKRLAAGARVDLDSVIAHAAHIDREIGFVVAHRLAMHLLSKATGNVRNPTAYIVTAFRNEPFVVQKWIDEEGGQ